jgi:hypothetical protein
MILEIMLSLKTMKLRRTYDHGVGVTSMTSPSGIREYYKYDPAGRLNVFWIKIIILSKNLNMVTLLLNSIIIK